MAGDALARRMGSVAAAFDDRLAVYSIVVEAIRSNPCTGFGLGAFEDFFPLYRDARAGYGGVWNAAHNTYLELMAALALCSRRNHAAQGRDTVQGSRRGRT